MSNLSHQDQLLTPKSISEITGESEGSSRRKLAAGVYGPALAPGTVVRGWAIRESVFWNHIAAKESEPAPRRVPAELKVDPEIEAALEGRRPRRSRRSGRGPPKKK